MYSCNIRVYLIKFLRLKQNKIFFQGELNERLKTACITDAGKLRKENEDSFCHQKLKNGLELFAVADGMGGYNAGEVASNIAVKVVSEYCTQHIEDDVKSDDVIHILDDAIAKANKVIYDESIKNKDYSGMGTTIVAAITNGEDMIIAHVGDSRAYILKDNSLNKLTNDHSLVAEMVRDGMITEDEAQRHPKKNIITRALGTDENVKVDIQKIHISMDDTVLLCTDGLSNMIEDKIIEQMLIKNSDVNKCARELVDLANKLGGRDNITVIIAKQSSPDSEVKQ